MRKKLIPMLVLVLVAAIGLTACQNREEYATDAAVTETIATDTALVQTETTATTTTWPETDTSVQTDTLGGGMATDTSLTDPAPPDTDVTGTSATTNTY